MKSPRHERGLFIAQSSRFSLAINAQGIGIAKIAQTSDHHLVWWCVGSLPEPLNGVPDKKHRNDRLNSITQTSRQEFAAKSFPWEWSTTPGNGGRQMEQQTEAALSL
jgi:hypothetical protein